MKKRRMPDVSGPQTPGTPDRPETASAPDSQPTAALPPEPPRDAAPAAEKAAENVHVEVVEVDEETPEA